MMRRALALSALVLLAPPAVAAPSAPTLTARPSATATSLPPGETPLANGAVAYRPAAAIAGPMPLIVLLHGAGHYPPGFLRKMEPVADRLGAIMLAPQSAGATWDMVQNMQRGLDPWHGPDARRLDQALGDVFGRAVIGPSRIVLLGFSDGASYALSLGLANPKLFTAVIALSPGILVPPRQPDRRQRIFIAHGRSDRVLPFSGARDMAGGLGQNVRFRPFDGGHQIDPASLAEALEWTLGPPGLQQSGAHPT